MQNKDVKPAIYQDQQVRAAIRELFSYQDFLAGMKAFVPVQLNKLILAEKDHVENAHDFQAKVIRPFLKTVKQSSISNFTFKRILPPTLPGREKLRDMKDWVHDLDPDPCSDALDPGCDLLWSNWQMLWGRN